MFIYFREKEKVHKWEEGQRERERREGILSRLHAVSTEPNGGLDLPNHEIMTQTEIKIWTLMVPGWLSQLSICLLISAQVMISQFPEFRPHI